MERPRVLRVEHQRARSLFCAARWRDAGEGRAPRTVPALSLGLAWAGCHGMALPRAWSPCFGWFFSPPLYKGAVRAPLVQPTQSLPFLRVKVSAGAHEEQRNGDRVRQPCPTSLRSSVRPCPKGQSAPSQRCLFTQDLLHKAERRERAPRRAASGRQGDMG